MQNLSITGLRPASIRCPGKIENTDKKNSNNIVQNTEQIFSSKTKQCTQNSIANTHSATLHAITESATLAAIAATSPIMGKNFLLRFFDNIGALLKKIFSSFRSENSSKGSVQSSSNTLRPAPGQDINALDELETPQKAINKKPSFGELKQNLEKRLSELQAFPDANRDRINNLKIRLSYLEKLDTMGSFLQLSFKIMSVSKYAQKEQIEGAKKALKKLEVLGVKNLEIPGGFEAVWGDDNFKDEKGNKVPNKDRRLLSALSSATINLDFETFEKLYRQLKDENCLSNKKFNDLMTATVKKIETAKNNMIPVANVFAADGSKLSENLRQQLWQM